MSLVVRTSGTLLADVARVANRTRATRRGAHRIEVRFPLTASTDVAFAISLRVPRRRPRAQSELRRWSATVATASLYVFAAVAPIATVVAGPQLARLAALTEVTPPVVAYAVQDYPARPLVRARGSLTTTFS